MKSKSYSFGFIVVLINVIFLSLYMLFQVGSTPQVRWIGRIDRILQAAETRYLVMESDTSLFKGAGVIYYVVSKYELSQYPEEVIYLSGEDANYQAYRSD